jgi:cellulose synthase/poly-beta-1,6-N-acetylglucosamine synthase-like glycosyltransferase
MREGSVIYYFWAFCYVSVQIALSLYGLHRYVILYLYLKHRKKVPKPAGTFAVLPKVTVQLPIFNELYVVERLIQSVSQIEYPKDKLEIQVLDDSTDETCEMAEAEVMKLCARGFNAKYLHRENRVGFKAGALEEGLKVAEGEFVFILDADFVPTPDILKKTIDHFTDPNVGMVQTRWGHLNRNYSLLTRVQSMFIDAHFVLEQVARSRSGRFFNFNGTAGIWRRSCIDASGGWQHDTLTEDLDLSYRAQLKGWKFIYVDDVVTPAELPVEMNGFKSQQHRWAKGSVQTCMKLLPELWRSKLPVLVKIEGTAHLTGYFICLFLALFCLLIFPTLDYTQHGLIRVLFFDTPVFILSSLPAVTFYLFAQQRLYPKSWIKELLLMPVLTALGVGVSLNNARAVLEALLNHQSGFMRTPKYGIEKNKAGIRKPRYAPLKSLLTVAEMAFAAYFAWLVVYALAMDEYGAVPFLVLFQIGFLYVAVCSVSHSLPRVSLPSREPEDALTA